MENFTAGESLRSASAQENSAKNHGLADTVLSTEKLFTHYGKVVVDASVRHPAISTSIAAAPIVLGVLAHVPVASEEMTLLGNRLGKWMGFETSIRTDEPLRSLIQIEGYGSARRKAVEMERIVAAARDGIAKGDLPTASDIQNFIANKYLPEMRDLGGYMRRDYKEAKMLPKHESYMGRLTNLVQTSDRHVATAEIDGKQLQFVTTVRDDTFAIFFGSNTFWSLPDSPEVFAAVDARNNELFAELQASKRMLATPAALNNNLSRVAEMEWLNAQTWRYPRGSAGISQLEARTWLETAGIDSGRYKAGIDPNLEALTRSLDDYKQAYPTFFETPPHYFKKPGLDWHGFSHLFNSSGGHAPA